METKIFNLIVLDASGSMMSICQEAVDGVNETIQTIRALQEKHPNQHHYLSLVIFNSAETMVRYNCTPIADVKELRNRDYNPDCSTPLYDAIGRSVTMMRENMHEEDLALVTIITDGMENSSRKYTASDIRKLISDLQKREWVFNYIGADAASLREAADLSIRNRVQYEKTKEGARGLFQGLNRCYSSACDKVADGQLFSEQDNFFFNF